ncbi:hypothetical protein D3C81_2037830 [compost metagenome]
MHSQISSGISPNTVISAGRTQRVSVKRLSIRLSASRKAKITTPGIARPSTPLLNVAMAMPSANTIQLALALCRAACCRWA